MRWQGLHIAVIALSGCTPTDRSRLLPVDSWFSGTSTDSAEPVDTDRPDTSDTSTGTTGTDSAVDDSGTPTTYTYAWDNPEWWGLNGPLQGVFDFELAVPGPHWRFWYITSPDLEEWSEPVVVGHNYSSLDLLRVDRGLILTGSLLPDVNNGMDAPYGNVFMLVTTDLVSWGSHHFPVEGADELPMIIDPSIHREGEGFRALFFGADLTVDPDIPPDDYPNPHYIRTGMVVDDRVVVEDITPFVEGDYIVDPTGCWWNDVHHILATNKYGDLFHQYRRVGQANFVDGLQWGGVQVPFCFIDEQNNRMGFIAQHGGGHGPPRVRWCDEEQDCTEQVALVPEEKLYLGQCTSPVVAWFQDQYVMFCSSWWE